MTDLLPPVNKRLDVVDALRGFALLAIVILHSMEHYNLYHIPEGMPGCLTWLDQGVWETAFFLMAGKAYATFSLLFGFSFYIQFRNEQARGGDFRGRFAWRMFLLFLFAQFHSLFYNGDILLLYAVAGLLLIPVCRLKDKTVFIIALACLFQPFEWGRVLYSIYNPGYTPLSDGYVAYKQLALPVMKDGNFLELLRSNIWHGQLYSNFWQVEHGRLFQTAVLFMCGLLLGRRQYFIPCAQSVRRWRTVCTVCAVAFFPLWYLKANMGDMLGTADLDRLAVPMDIIFQSWFNIAFMGLLVAAFTLAWFRANGLRIQRFIIPYGRITTSRNPSSACSCTTATASACTKRPEPRPPSLLASASWVSNSSGAADGWPGTSKAPLKPSGAREHGSVINATGHKHSNLDIRLRTS